MRDVGGEALRRRALAALGVFGDGRAVRVLEEAAIDVERGVATWQGSEGIVRAHRVTLAIDATLLATVHSTPAVRDALHASLAAAVAEAPREMLGELRLRWRSRSHGGVATPYRGIVAGPTGDGALETPLREGLEGYLRASGNHALADVVARSDVAMAGAPDHGRGDGEAARCAVRVEVDSDDVVYLARARAKLEEALGALLEGDHFAATTVSVRARPAG